MPRIIAHATDLTGADRPAFVHAAALAAVSGARLVTVHGAAPAGDASGLPDAAPLAARWGRPVDHWRFAHRCCEDVTATVLDAVRTVAPELVVAGTRARHGVTAALAGSVAESLARHLDVPSLVVPNQGRGFVDERTGVIDLHRLIVPAADAATAARGLAAAHALLALAHVGGAELIVLTVGERALDVPLAGDTRGLRAEGPIDEAILRAAVARDASVIVMPTSGAGVDDVFFGSHTEHVIRGAGRAVLTVPPRP